MQKHSVDTVNSNVIKMIDILKICSCNLFNVTAKNVCQVSFWQEKTNSC